MIFRRQILERDLPTNFRCVLAECRRISGMGSSELAHVLNVPRGTLWSWERPAPSVPNYEDGIAILKLLLQLRRNSGTCEAEIAA